MAWWWASYLMLHHHTTSLEKWNHFIKKLLFAQQKLLQSLSARILETSRHGFDLHQNLPRSSSGWWRSPRGGHGNPLQYSCLENPMEPGGLQSIASQRVGHHWSDLARTPWAVKDSRIWLSKIDTKGFLFGFFFNLGEVGRRVFEEQRKERIVLRVQWHSNPQRLVSHFVSFFY